MRAMLPRELHAHHWGHSMFNLRGRSIPGCSGVDDLRTLHRRALLCRCRLYAVLDLRELRGGAVLGSGGQHLHELHSRHVRGEHGYIHVLSLWRRLLLGVGG